MLNACSGKRAFNTKKSLLKLGKVGSRVRLNGIGKGREKIK